MFKWGRWKVLRKNIKPFIHNTEKWPKILLKQILVIFLTLIMKGLKVLVSCVFLKVETKCTEWSKTVK